MIYKQEKEQRTKEKQQQKQQEELAKQQELRRKEAEREQKRKYGRGFDLLRKKFAYDLFDNKKCVFFLSEKQRKRRNAVKQIWHV